MDEKNPVFAVFSEGRAHAVLLSGPWPCDKTALVAELPADVRVQLVRPVDEKTGEKKKQIPLAMVEELLQNLSLMHQGRKLVVIEDADHLNDQAQNALLKAVEEPARNTVLVFLAEDPSRILPTLRSRMVHLTVMPTAPETAAALAPLQSQVDAFLAAPRSRRLTEVVAMTKGDEAQAADSLERFLEALAHTLHATLHQKYATMGSEQRRALIGALSLLAQAPQVLRENASPTLLMERIVLTLP